MEAFQMAVSRLGYVTLKKPFLLGIFGNNIKK
jgi:hypothetical protein